MITTKIITLQLPIELFPPHFLEQVWKEKGGKHKELIEPRYVRLDNLKTLADFTQQLYLGMPSYFSWREAKRRKGKIKGGVHNGVQSDSVKQKQPK